MKIEDKWTKEYLEGFVNAFKSLPNPLVSKMYGMSNIQLYRIAKRLGIKKMSRRMECRWDQSKKDLFKQMYENGSNEAVAKEFDISSDTVYNIAKRMGLHKSREYLQKIMGDKQQKGLEVIRKVMTTERRRATSGAATRDLIRRDKLRAFYGMPQLTKRKYGHNRSKSNARTKLRKYGYRIDNGKDECYYDDSTKRNHSLEKRYIEIYHFDFLELCK